MKKERRILQRLQRDKWVPMRDKNNHARRSISHEAKLTLSLEKNKWKVVSCPDELGIHLEDPRGSLPSSGREKGERGKRRKLQGRKHSPSQSTHRTEQKKKGVENAPTIEENEKRTCCSNKLQKTKNRCLGLNGSRRARDSDVDTSYWEASGSSPRGQPINYCQIRAHHGLLQQKGDCRKTDNRSGILDGQQNLIASEFKRPFIFRANRDS